ncbi:sugar ABC transporter permease [Longispora sp. K20-0274]|uniref:carbohydrate ABC transporter permease n=1 Tax=Longispora sp. K20-0274 TaxID=3088255 RepID=UPI00399AE5BB
MRRTTPYLYIAPFFLLFAVFGLFPLVYTAWVSLHDWNLLGGHTFVGLDNYTALLGDEHFWNATGNTVGMFVLSTVPQLLLALAIANALHKRMRARTAVRLGILLPNITSVAAVGIVFSLVFANNFGLANWVLGLVGVDPVNWTAEKWSSWSAIAVMVDWRWTGWNALIYLAAMQTIPADLYEAAAIEGASAWKQFWRITVPLLRPTILFTAIIATIGGMQLFAEPLLLGSGRIEGGSLRQFQTLSMYIYERAFGRDFDYGYGSAMAWVLFLLILVASLVNFALVRRGAR